MTSKFFLLAMLATLPGAAADIALSWGAGPKGTTSVNTPLGSVTTADSTGTTLLDLGTKFIGFGPVSLNFDLPVAFGGPGYANAVAQSGSAAAYTERMKWAVTPGLKVRVGLGVVAPWVSFGAGGARLERAGSLFSLSSLTSTQALQGWSLAFSTAGGVDIRPIPILFFRGEVRSYTLKPAESLFSSSNLLQNIGWRNNLLFMAGVGARF